MARTRVRHELRYAGQAFELPVDDENGPMSAAELRSAFEQAHETRYGYRDQQADVELVNLRASVWGEAPALEPRAHAGETPAQPERTPIVLGGERVDAALLRGEPVPGTALEGPALFALPEATLLVAPGWSAEVDDHGTISMRRVSSS